jgi:hypothetical protein
MARRRSVICRPPAPPLCVSDPRGPSPASCCPRSRCRSFRAPAQAAQSPIRSNPPRRRPRPQTARFLPFASRARPLFPLRSKASRGCRSSLHRKLRTPPPSRESTRGSCSNTCCPFQQTVLPETDYPARSLSRRWPPLLPPPAKPLTRADETKRPIRQGRFASRPEAKAVLGRRLANRSCRSVDGPRGRPAIERPSAGLVLALCGRA